MEIGITEIFLTIISLLVFGYFYITSSLSFWKNRNVKGQKPSIIFGNIKDYVVKKVTFGECLKTIYDSYVDEKFIGFFVKRNPCLMLRDPDLIKDVLIKDFSTFVDRGTLPVTKKTDPLSQHLFRLDPPRWQLLRPKFSPAFTSGKLKNMFYLMKNCADNFSKHLGKKVEKNNIVDIRDLSRKFIIDIIGDCVFGLQMNAVSDEESEFYKLGSKFLNVSSWDKFKFMVRDTSLSLYEFLSPIFYDKELNGFFINTLRDTMKYRKDNNVRRHDFVDLLRDVKDNETLNSNNDIELSDDLLAAQAFVFFIAGFETSTTTVSYTFYELAQNHEVQNKLRQEIHEELEKNGGELLYDSIKDLKYLNQVLSETLRKYPPLPLLTRTAMNDYTFKGTDLTIPKGMKVFIPTLAIQRDPKLYPNPEVYDPERFSEENIKERHSCIYLPFGDGPRNCIGARFGKVQSKVAISTVIKDYSIDVCDKTQIPIKFNPHDPVLLLTTSDGIYLKLTKINKK